MILKEAFKAFSEEPERMKEEMYDLRNISQIWDLDYYPPEEHDKIESRLFRYLALRNSLWELINYYVYDVVSFIHQ